MKKNGLVFKKAAQAKAWNDVITWLSSRVEKQFAYAMVKLRRAGLEDQRIRMLHSEVGIMMIKHTDAVQKRLDNIELEWE